MSQFTKLVYTPAGFRNVELVISACRAGGVGILNAELEPDSKFIINELDLVSRKVHGGYGLKVDAMDEVLASGIRDHARKGLNWLILDPHLVLSNETLIAELRHMGVRVLAEMTSPVWPNQPLDQKLDGLVLKGNESGGFVGEDSSFILLQKWLKQTGLPLYVRGGLTPHVAAACSAVGVAGGVLDAQLLLLDEARLSDELRALFGNLAGNETVAVGDGERGEYFRLLVRPGLVAARAFVDTGEGQGFNNLKSLVHGKTSWNEPRNGLLPIGQDICFAAPWRKQYQNMSGVFKAIDSAVEESLRVAVEARSIYQDAPLAKALGIQFPLIQGPMTRVSDCAEFAMSIAEGGALPMVAFALLKGAALQKLLEETARLLGDRPWGIGLLGFAPQALLDEQLTLATSFHPHYAIIAGGRPDQAVRLEAAGIPTFLHVPSANLIPLFLQEGARRFIFEGRECGGHIGPLSSFVLWSTMVDRLLAELAINKVNGNEIEAIFAGGIHDATSSAMLQVLAAPLVAKGMKIGILMGSAYLFTKEIVNSGAIVPLFQREVIECTRTVNLESGPGHASRCAYTPFAQEFFRTRAEMREQSVPADESRKTLDDLILGRLRIASKGSARRGADGHLQQLDETQQHLEGMYMLGQVATLRAEVTDVRSLHRQLTEDACSLLADRFDKIKQRHTAAAEKPVDIAIIGIASVLPKANSSQEYWENILDKVDAITEIPRHRWDWRLYFDEDRTAKDKIYSKWGGFLDDMVFDPTRYGMPPKSIESIDPMQLMALEVAQQTLSDAGYLDRDFDRTRTSVIIGASGGTGDVGTQYGLRSELTRFQGVLPEEVADRLPEWTEDSFAGILVNVIAGRIANRLNLGGVNFTTDAACASSLAAVYQGVSELSARRSDMVIAGGVDTVQGPFGYLCFSKTQALSPRGCCSTFDTSGDGIVISEGIAMIALKRLDDAERDGDRIYAVIKGVGGSSDGNAKGMTAPLPAGQVRAMRRAYTQAGFGSDTIALFEAHGTGTVAGDTAELESTATIINERGGKPRQAAIGSVKTMIGHTKATAGMAGLIKAALALHHRVLPPHRGVSQPNKLLQEIESPLYLIDQALPWIAAKNSPRRAAASAFGFGGTNFHVVMEEYTREYREWLRPATRLRWPSELLLWSGASRGELIARLTGQQSALEKIQRIELRDLASNLAEKWQSGKETVAIVAQDLPDLAAKIAGALTHLQDEKIALPAGVYHGGTLPEGKLAVLFPGQGSQYPDMLREVALHFPVCAEKLSEADGILGDAFVRRFGEGVSLTHFIFPRGCYSEEAKAEAKQSLTSTDVAQPALGAVEAGLWSMLQSFGLETDMLAGHSYGEFVALYASGAIDFNALMLLSAARGRLIVDAAKAGSTELGTMAAVQAPRSDVEAAIAGINGVVIANHNAPLQSILSGSKSAIDAVIEKLTIAGIMVTEIPVAAAFHSSLVAPAQHELAGLINDTPWQGCDIPVYSNTTAKPHSASFAETRQLMSDHLVRPVEFVAEIEAMYEDGARIFLELGPKSVLTKLTGKILEGRPHLAVAVDDGTGLTGMLHAFAKLISAGVKLDVKKLFEGRNCITADPGKPELLQRDKPVPKHAWMLNGSGARRVGEPVRQIGITLDELGSQPMQPVPAGLGKPKYTGSEPGPDVTTQSVSRKQLRKEYKMGERRPPPIAGDSAIMAEYFETMRQFLETQERVMGMFIGEPLANQPVVRQQRNTQVLSSPRALNIEPVQIPAYAKQPPAETKLPAKEVIVSAPALPVQKSAAPVLPQTADSTGKSNQNTGAQAGINRDRMVDMLLGIVEDKTGYPRDMVGLDQNLESDLGIDSIKRIEVVGAMLQMLPESYRRELGGNRSKLNTQPTLNGMLNILCEMKIGGAVTIPFDYAGAGVAAAVVSHLPRHIIKPEQEHLDGTALRQLRQGHYLITEDKLGVSAELAQMLIARGCTVGLVKRNVLEREDLLVEWCAEQNNPAEPLAGILHLAQLGSDWLGTDAKLDDWRNQLQTNEKSLFMLLHNFSNHLANDAHIVSASALGGFFNRQGSIARGLSLQSGAAGMLKSLYDERPTLRVKVVDVDPALDPSPIAAILLDETELVGGRHEVGYPNGIRTVFRTVASPVNTGGEQKMRGIVVLSTGGAKGVTAEVLRELALPGTTLVLTGRNPLPEQESEVLGALRDADALRQYFISEMRNSGAQSTPAEIKKKIQTILAARELRGNIEDFRQRGATVEYHSVDVTDEDAMRQLLDALYERHGRIDGIVHGAGIIEDKLLMDKSNDSWSRVVETKVMGLLLLQKYLRPESLKFFSVFSSVAGRYGNSGQSDYATANELMNRLCCQLRDHWGDRVNVNALCWGPWGQTKFGAGMVTAETEAKFAEKGVKLVSADTGRQLFIDELTRSENSAVEIICGEGPWELRESTIGEIRKQPAVSPGKVLGPILGNAEVSTTPKGGQIVHFCLDENHTYLQQHRIDGIAVLPAAAALEMLAEAVQSLWGGWKVVELRDFRLIKGIELKAPGSKFSVVVDPPPYGSSEGFEVNATLQSEQNDGRTLVHYRAVLRLEQQLQNSFAHVPRPHSEKELSTTKAYDEWLFHGPCFQVIKNIGGMSSAGSGARVQTTRPTNWLSNVAPEHDCWNFDPAVIDAAAQMAILWARSFRNQTSLPTKFGRVIRYRETFPESLHMEFEHIVSSDVNLVCANVHFTDSDGHVVMLIEDMQCIASEALNRLGGTSRVTSKIPA